MASQTRIKALVNSWTICDATWHWCMECDMMSSMCSVAFRSGKEVDQYIASIHWSWRTGDTRSLTQGPLVNLVDLPILMLSGKCTVLGCKNRLHFWTLGSHTNLVESVSDSLSRTMHQWPAGGHFAGALSTGGPFTGF